MPKSILVTLTFMIAMISATASAQGCIPADPSSKIVVLSASIKFGSSNGLAFGNQRMANAAEQIEISGSTGSPVVLVLSAASPKIWNLENVDKSTLKGVIMAGANHAIAGIQPDVPVASQYGSGMISRFGNPTSRCSIGYVGLGGDRTKNEIRKMIRETGLKPLGFSALLNGSSFDLSRPDSTGDFRWVPLPPAALISTGPMVPFGTIDTTAERIPPGDMGSHMASWDDRGIVIKESFPDSSKGSTDPEAMSPIGSVDGNPTGTNAPMIDPFERTINSRSSMGDGQSRSEAEWSSSMTLFGLLVAAMAGAAAIIILIGRRISDRQIAPSTNESSLPSPLTTATKTPQQQRVTERAVVREAPRPVVSTTSETDQTLKLLLDHVSDDDTVLALSRVRRSARTSANLDEDLAEERDRIVGPHLSGLVDRYVAAARAPGADGPGVESMLRDSLQRLLAALEALNEAQRKRGVDGLATSREFIRQRHPGRNDDGGIGPVD